MGEYMLEEEAILVDLSIEELEEVPSRNNIIRQWRRAIAFVVGIIEVPLHPPPMPTCWVGIVLVVQGATVVIDSGGATGIK
jgi:hypothetical protein